MKNFFHYIFAMLYFQTNGTCSGSAKVLNGVSHDTLNRNLRKQWSGQKRLEAVMEPEKMKGGYLIIDDTPIEIAPFKKIGRVMVGVLLDGRQGCVWLLPCCVALDRWEDPYSHWL